MKPHTFKSFSSIRFFSGSAANVLRTGDILKQSRIFSFSDISEYSKLTHDSNPLHFDPDCAKSAGFARIPVPGILVASLFPSIIASHFPGAVYAKQTLDFRSPVFIDDCITGEVQAGNIRQMKNKFLVKFVTKCFRDDGDVVICGEATAILPDLVVERASQSCLNTEILLHGNNEP